MHALAKFTYSFDRLVGLKNKYLKYGLLLFAVIAVAIFTGKYLSETSLKINTNTENENSAQSTIEQENREAFERADYIAAPPTFGPIIKTIPLDVEFQKNQAVGFLSLESFSQIKHRQDVILFDKEAYVLPLGGEIIGIEPNDDTDQQKITIQLPEETNTEFLASTVEIITLETLASKRISLEALQQDTNKKDFVWIAYNEEENATAFNKVRRLYIEIGQSDRDYFEENGHKIESFDPIIINPDDKIKSDKKYDIFATEIAGPMHNPIRQALIDYEVFRLEAQQEELQKIADDCANGKKALILKPGALTLSDGTQTGSGCGQASNAPTDPMAIFKALTSGNDSSGSGCASSTACGQ